jgi:hypothetical protein
VYPYAVLSTANAPWCMLCYYARDMSLFCHGASVTFVTLPSRSERDMWQIIGVFERPFFVTL